jgi:hypothetical protein
MGIMQGGTIPSSLSIPYVLNYKPFLSPKVRLNTTRCAKIVTSQTLDDDLNAGTLPQYSFFTPDVHSDGHEYLFNFTLPN